MKFVFIPDSFKGTLASDEICSLLEDRARSVFPDCETVSIPVADGGEGSVDCFLAALGGDKIKLTVKNPFFEDMEGFYGLTDNGDTAIVEMASCAGLPLIEDRKNPLLATTYGVGQTIAAAAKSGAGKIIVGLGGSATNDGGCGAAAAVGIRFFDKNGKEFVPVGGTLCDIASIDFSCRDKALDSVKITTMCDIDNPMYGENGAAYVFGPQKGADSRMIQILDDGLRHLAEVIRRDGGVDVSSIPGGGAAGAMGAGMVAFFGSELKMGIDTVLDTVGFDKLIADADYIFTGEGRLDSQSLRGKVVVGVARRAKRLGRPVIAIVGGVTRGVDEIYGEGVSAVFSINRLPEDFSVSRAKSRDNFSDTAGDVFRMLKAARK